MNISGCSGKFSGSLVIKPGFLTVSDAILTLSFVQEFFLAVKYATIMPTQVLLIGDGRINKTVLEKAGSPWPAKERYDIDIDYMGLWNEMPWGLAPGVGGRFNGEFLGHRWSFSTFHHPCTVMFVDCMFRTTDLFHMLSYMCTILVVNVAIPSTEQIGKGL